MEIKISTKEKLSVLYLPESPFSVNMAEQLAAITAKILQQPIKNAVINFANVAAASPEALTALTDMYRKATQNNASFILCNIAAPIKKRLTEMNLWNELNATPTESEAIDMTYMEEMEREMLGNFITEEEG